MNVTPDDDNMLEKDDMEKSYDFYDLKAKKDDYEEGADEIMSPTKMEDKKYLTEFEDKTDRMIMESRIYPEEGQKVSTGKSEVMEYEEKTNIIIHLKNELFKS